MWGISLLAANQLASEEGLCTMEYISISIRFLFIDAVIIYHT